MMEINCSSCRCIISVFASHQRICVVKNVCKVYKLSRAYERVGTRGTSYSGLLGTGAREDE